MQKVDYLIVGGGVVGLAIGAALSPFGSTAVLERRKSLIEETSARNSGVVHAGLYYPEDSLKQKFCVRGNQQIWHMSEKFSGTIKARRIGKWIGTCEDSEEPALQKIIDNMKKRGIKHEMISKDVMKKEEPLLSMKTVVNSVNTGIVDVHSLRDYYVNVINSSEEGFIACSQEVVQIDFEPSSKKLRVSIRDPTEKSGEAETLEVTGAVVCASGLHANALWSSILLEQTKVQQPPSHVLQYCKGRYATYQGKPLVHRLVYPCPLPGLVGLGVHSVVDMDGRVKFGPDAIYVDDCSNYAVANSESEEKQFLDSQYEAVKRYLPSMERSHLQPDFSGIRPKLSGPGEPARDFVMDEILSADAAGVVKLSPLGINPSNAGPRLVFLNGIESPGLTASSAIGEHVAQCLIPEDKYSKHVPSWVA